MFGLFFASNTSACPPWRCSCRYHSPNSVFLAVFFFYNFVFSVLLRYPKSIKIIEVTLDKQLLWLATSSVTSAGIVLSTNGDVSVMVNGVPSDIWIACNSDSSLEKVLWSDFQKTLV